MRVFNILLVYGMLELGSTPSWGMNFAAEPGKEAAVQGATS